MVTDNGFSRVGAGIKNYALGRLVGRGMFSEVYLGTHTLTGTPVAIKVLNRLGTDENTLNREIRAMKLVRGHPHVVTLFEVVQAADYVYMVMDYCANGTLDSYLMRHGKVKEATARLWFHQLVDAVRHCHTKRVVHMDIKPANIYLDERSNLKLGDFGLAAVTVDAYAEEINFDGGTAVYAAPEQYGHNSFLGPKAAMWALGSVLHAMLARSLPFTVEGYPHDGQVYTPPDGLTNNCQALLCALFDRSPIARPNEKEILQHPWMRHDGGACCCLCICEDHRATRSAPTTPLRRSCALTRPNSSPGRPATVEHTHLNCSRNDLNGSSYVLVANDCIERAWKRMSQLGFEADVIDSAAHSTAVFEHSAATFAILLSSECRNAHLRNDRVADDIDSHWTTPAPPAPLAVRERSAVPTHG